MKATIYPEYQRSMIVDTQLWAKGLPIVGNGFGVVADLSKKEGGALPGAKQIAWRMTATALKNNIKDMYQGQLIVMGDPSVKPYDRIWINDMYENMEGECSVEAVVHSFNAQSGFTTSIYPDCISAVDDEYERYNEQMLRQCLIPPITYAAACGLNISLHKGLVRASNAVLGSWIAKGGNFLAEHLQNILSILDVDPSKANKYTKNILKGTAKLTDVVNYDFGADYFSNLINRYKTLDLIKRKEMGSINDIIAFLTENGQKLDDLNPATVYNTLTEGSNLSASELDKFLNASSEYGQLINGAISETFNFSDDFFVSLEKIAKALEEASGETVDFKDSIKILHEIVASKKIKNAKQMIQLGKALENAKKVENAAEGLTEATKVLDTVKDMAKATDKIKDGVKLLDNVQDIITGLLAVTGPAGVIIAVAKMVIEAVITAVIGAYVTESIERYLQDLQVLQIYPLSKNGYVMTAGLVGHKGLVVGSPTENEQGAWTTWVTDLFGAKPPTGPLSWIAQGFFTNDRIRAICSKYRVTNQKIDPLSSSFDAEKMASQMVENMSQVYAKYALHDEKSFFKVKRYQTIEEASKHIQSYLIKSDENSNVLSAQVQKELVPIQCDTVLNSYIIKNILCLFSTTTPDTQVTGTFNGEQVTMYCRVKSGYYDIPALRPEALVILRELCSAYNVFAKFNTENENLEQNIKENCLILTSGTIVNDNSYQGTGYAFRLNTGTEDKNKNPNLTKAVEKVYNDHTSYAKDGSTVIEAFLYYYDKTAYEYVIYITPPVEPAQAAGTENPETTETDKNNSASSNESEEK